MPEDTRVNLKISREVWHEHNEIRQECGQSWSEYLCQCTHESLEQSDSTPVRNQSDAVSTTVLNETDLATELSRKFDYGMLADKVAERVIAELH